MNISRNFLLFGTLYLLLGMGLGMHMGSSGNHTLAPVHAHINLVGFTLMAVFAVAYKVFPAMADNTLARVHFWLHQIGALVLIVALFLMIGGFVAAAKVGPVMPVAEICLLLGTAIFAYNTFKNAG